MTLFVFPRVLDVLMKREGKEVTLPTLASLTGFDERQIQNAIANARRTDKNHAARIEVVKLGKSWKFDSSAGGNGEDTVEGILEDVKMGSTHIWKRVLDAIATRPGVILTKEEIAKIVTESGVKMRPDQVVGAMTTIMRKPLIGSNVEVVQVNFAWRFKATTSKPATGVKAGSDTVSTSIRASVLRYFSLKPGVTHFVDDIAQDLGFTRKQVQNSMYYVLTGDGTPIKDDFVVVVAGQAWQYVPNRGKSNGQVNAPAKVPALAANVAPQREVVAYTPQTATTTLPVTPAGATSKRTFEELMVTKAGTIIIRDQEGTLYQASELELDV